MILCRALSYEENTLDKSRLRSSICKITPMSMDSPTASTTRTTDGAAAILTAPAGKA